MSSSANWTGSALRALTAVAGQRPLVPSERARLQALRGQYQGDRDRGHLNSQTALAGNLTLSGDLETLDIIDGVTGDVFFAALDRDVLQADAPTSAAFEQAQRPVQTCLQVYDAERDAATHSTEAHIEQGAACATFTFTFSCSPLCWALPPRACWSVPGASRRKPPPPASRRRPTNATWRPWYRLPRSPVRAVPRVFREAVWPRIFALGGPQLRQTAAEVSLEASQARLLAERLAQAADIRGGADRGDGARRRVAVHLSERPDEPGERHGQRQPSRRSVAQAGLQAVRGRCGS